MSDMEGLLGETVRRQASDLHLVAGQPPRIRHLGELAELDPEPLPEALVRTELYAIMPGPLRASFEQNDGADFAITVRDLARFRVNVFRHLYGMGAVFRTIPEAAQSLTQLGLPEILATLCNERQGLILVTGKTGSGKSTTLAAMIDHINASRKGHIITIEDPIEFVHTRRRSLVSQRNVGEHTRSFAAALRSALREDPDVILIGELRDLETMSLAVTAAETGILVLATLHTNSASATLDRVVNTFPFSKQTQVRTMLSTSLRAVISQQLVRTADATSRVAVVEIMVNTPAVANILREGRTNQLGNVIQSGAAEGMQSMDAELRRLVEAKVITGQEAYANALEKASFEQLRAASR